MKLKPQLVLEAMEGELPYYASIAHADPNDEKQRDLFVRYAGQLIEKGIQVKPKVITDYNVFRYVGGHLVTCADGLVYTDAELTTKQRDFREWSWPLKSAAKILEEYQDRLGLEESDKDIMLTKIIPALTNLVEKERELRLGGLQISPDF